MIKMEAHHHPISHKLSSGILKAGHCSIQLNSQNDKHHIITPHFKLYYRIY